MSVTHVDRSGDILSVSKMVEQPAPVAALAKLNRVPLAGVAGKGCCDPGAGAGGDAPPAAGDAPRSAGDDPGDGVGEAVEDPLGDSEAGREAGSGAGKAGEEAGGEAETLPGLGNTGDDALAPASINTDACMQKYICEGVRYKCQAAGAGGPGGGRGGGRGVWGGVRMS